MNIGNNRQWVDGMWEKIDNKLSKTAIEVRNILPYEVINGKYQDMSEKDPGWWTNGFYGGMMWLMYKATGNEDYRLTAERHEELLDVVFDNFDRFDHDIGFMWGLTAKANYIQTGNKKSRTRALLTANILSSRANIKADFIRAWNHEKSYSIIDCMMNLPILYWASRELEDKRFEYVAKMHADMAMKEHVREDGSVVHICVHDEESNKIVETLAGQGCAVDSAWSRGQAWAVYGFVLSYIHTGDNKYLDTAKIAADYFLSCAEKNNYKVLTDFRAPEEPVYYDTSAAVCAACGMIEIYKATNEQKYLDGAINILKAVEEDCIFDNTNQSILQNGMVAYWSGKQEHLVYADFFLVEAILKLKGSDYLIW